MLRSNSPIGSEAEAVDETANQLPTFRHIDAELVGDFIEQPPCESVEGRKPIKRRAKRRRDEYDDDDSDSDTLVGNRLDLGFRMLEGSEPVW